MKGTFQIHDMFLKSRIIRTLVLKIMISIVLVNERYVPVDPN